MNIAELIQYEDKDILICKKEAGVAVQTKSYTQPDMISLLMNYRKEKKEDTYIGLIHRLDQPVEGIMVFAKNQKSASDLSKQVAQRSVDKYYYAVLEGELEQSHGELSDYLLKDAKTNLSKVVTKEVKGAKKAELSYEVVAIRKDKTLVKIQLKTGRHHQIRVQFSNMGHPLYGDAKYNTRQLKKHMPIGLCSYEIGFLHPATKKKMQFQMQPYGEAFFDFMDLFLDTLK